MAPVLTDQHCSSSVLGGRPAHCLPESGLLAWSEPCPPPGPGGSCTGGLHLPFCLSPEGSCGVQKRPRLLQEGRQVCVVAPGWLGLRRVPNIHVLEPQDPESKADTTKTSAVNTLTCTLTLGDTHMCTHTHAHLCTHIHTCS